jgi:phosphoribosylaminoimidazolecarboxamide formyltransferase/IMP cyclohydrolase
MKKAALISVSDKTGLVPFANALAQAGYQLLTTSGSGKYLQENGVDSESIEKYTGQVEIFGGRVKTLHPRIHAGILARRDSADDVRQLEEEKIYPIDVVVVNLYPFVENLQGDAAGDPARMIELVDIGGPTMIRAAAKNYKGVYPVIDPADYDSVLNCLTGDVAEEEQHSVRLGLATKVFGQLAEYNLQIARYFSNVTLDDSGDYQVDSENDFFLGGYSGQASELKQVLRYGENPHQKAAFYVPQGQSDIGWKQLNGKELSYNNLLDFDAALGIVRSLPRTSPGAAIIKHLNPCGAAVGVSLLEALQKSKLGDPRSHFGGIIALNDTVSLEVAEAIGEDFAEIVLAPAYEEDALAQLRKKKNLRVVEVNLDRVTPFCFRSINSGVLVQEADSSVSEVKNGELKTTHKASESQLADLQLAWALCAHVKSNAITIVKDGVLLSAGAGQMSRIDAVEVALLKAATHKHDLEGAVAASDAFFPFTDCIEILSEKGIRGIVVPGGARRDEEVTAKAEALGVSLYFTSDRHFRH